MPHVFQTFDKNGKPHKRWRFQYVDWTGKKRTATGCTTRTKTEDTALIVQVEQDKIRKLKIKPAPKRSDQAHLFATVAGEYLAWGKSQGGHGGRPWSKYHLSQRKRHMTFWGEQLNLSWLSDIELTQVEAVARKLQDAGKSGKTIQLHLESLKAVVQWALRHRYLEVDPLLCLAKFDDTAKEVRRALDESELDALLDAAPSDRRILYETAVCTGYRKGELDALTVADLDVKHCTLPLAAEFCKGRRDARQPIPASLAAKLKEAAKGKDVRAKLFNVDFHIDRLFHRDRKKAQIAETTTEGKAVFHSLRHTYCTLVIDSGATMKEAQQLMRHSDPRLTMNIYSHARKDRLQHVAEAVGNVVMKNSGTMAAQRESYGEGVEQLSTGAASTLSEEEVKRVKGFEPSTSTLATRPG